MTVFGLPLHPLVVHAAIVLLPLAAFGAVVIALSRRARTRYGWLVFLIALLAGGSVAAARISGESFAGTTTGTGALGTHMMWGLLAPWPAAALVLTTLAVMLAGRSESRALRLTAGALAIASAVAATVVIVLVGHSGATAVWGGQG